MEWQSGRAAYALEQVDSCFGDLRGGVEDGAGSAGRRVCSAMEKGKTFLDAFGPCFLFGLRMYQSPMIRCGHVVEELRGGFVGIGHRLVRKVVHFGPCGSESLCVLQVAARYG